MHGKPLSSLDYASLLHELTLNNWTEAILREDWRRAVTAAGKLAESTERFWSWLGLLNLSITYLARGKATTALERLDEAASTYPESVHLAATARNMAAHVLIEIDRAAEAVAYAEQAIISAGTGPLAHESLYFMGLAKLRIGDQQEVSRVLDHLEQQTRASSLTEGRARFYQLSGEIGLAQGATESAIRALEQARAILKAASISRPRFQEPIRLSLALAYLADGRQTEALRNAVENAEDKRGLLEWPIPFIRSLHFVGNLYKEAGELSLAKKHYERFIAYWSEGELDSQKIGEAERFLEDYKIS